MACFDSGQALVASTTPVPLFTVTDPGVKNVILYVSQTSGSTFFGNSPNVSASNGALIPSGFPISLNAIAGRGTTLYAVGNGGSGTVYWMVGA